MATRRKRRAKKQKQKQTIPEFSEPIVCSFLERTQYAGVIPDWEPDLKKCGTYHGSVFHEVEGWGKKKWVVGGYIKVDYEKYQEGGMTIEEILAACVAWLNQPPARKKYQRRQKNSLYGTLDPMPLKWWFKEMDGEKCIGVLVVTDKRKCKHFWGEGMKL